MAPLALLITNEDVLRASIAAFLQSEGATTAFVSGQEEVLARIEQARFDLIYFDLAVGATENASRPAEGPLSAFCLRVLETVRERAEPTPVILIAQDSNPRAAAQALERGAFAYWLKPVAPDTLLFGSRQALENKLLWEKKERQEARKEEYQRTLEKRVADRTRELTAANLRLTDEIKERRLAQDTLLKTHGYLEQRIRERTVEIETANKLLQQEILDRREAEHSLLESEERYRTVFKNASDAILLTRFDPERLLGAALEINDAACRWVGLERERILGQSPLAFFAFAPSLPQLQGPDAGKAPYAFDVVFANANGTRIPAEASAHVFPFRGQQVVLAIFRDLSLRKRSEKFSHLLARELITAQEAERQRIARDIHDHIGQDLLSLKIGLKMLLTRKPATAAELSQRVVELAKQLQDTLSTVRDLAYDLRPPGLDQLGAIRTIYHYCEDFCSRNELQVEFACAGMDHIEIRPDVGINIYRIIQEALSNIKKHAQANTVTVRLVYSHPNIMLRIEDNGRGFDVEKRLETALAEKRMGLQSMKERVALLNGLLRLRSKHGKGTLISIQIPHGEELHAHS
jgi:PAS domain S-box-containing protein